MGVEHNERRHHLKATTEVEVTDVSGRGGGAAMDDHGCDVKGEETPLKSNDDNKSGGVLVVVGEEEPPWCPWTQHGGDVAPLEGNDSCGSGRWWL
jgi:hypothetical protein